LSSESRKLDTILPDASPSSSGVDTHFSAPSPSLEDPRIQLVDQDYALRTQIAALKSEAERLNTEIAGKKNVLDSQLRLQTAELKKLEAQITLKKAEVEVELESIGTAHVQATAEWERLRTQIANGTAELEQLHRTIEHDRQRVRELESRASELEAAARHSEASQRSAEMAREVAEREKYVALDETRKFQAETRTLRDELASKTQEFTLLGERRTNLGLAISGLERTKEELSTECALAQSRLDQSRSEQSVVLLTLESARSETAALRKEASEIIGRAQAEADRIAREAVSRAETEARTAAMRIEQDAERSAALVKREAESAAELRVAEAEHRAASLRSDAESAAQIVKESADSYALRARTDADQYGFETRRAADQEVAQIRDELARECQQKRDEVAGELEVLRRDAGVEVETKLFQAQQDYDDIVSQAHDEMRHLRAATIRDAEIEAERIQEQIDALERSSHIEAEKIIARAREEEALILQSAEDQASATRSKGDREYQERKALEDKQIIEGRYRAQADLDSWLEQEKKSYLARRKQDQKEIIRVVGALINNRVKPVVDKKNSRSSLRDLADDIGDILENAFTRGDQGKDLDLDRLANLGHKGHSRSKQYWQDLFLRVVLPVLGVVILLSLPVVRHGIASLFAPKAGKSLQQTYVETQNQKAQQEREYHPAQTPDIKDTYADNVLFTTNYVETVLGKAYQQKWTLALTKFVVKDLDLRDDIVIRLQPRETLLIKELDRTRKEINAKYLNESLERMHAAEQDALDKMTVWLGGAANYEKFVAFRNQFYRDFTAKSAP
jgi:hypothetical protein